MAVCDEVVDRFGDDEGPLLDSVAMALLHKGLALHGLKRGEDALAVLEELLDRFRASDVTEIQNSVLRAMATMAMVLNGLNRPADALAVCDEMTKRIDGGGHAGAGLVGAGLVQSASAHLALDRPREALAACDDALHRFARTLSSERVWSLSCLLSPWLQDQGSGSAGQAAGRTRGVRRV